MLWAFCLITSFNLFSQDCSLSCSSTAIDIILDSDCEHTVILADVLSSSMDCDGPLIVELFNEVGQPIPSSPVIDGGYIGQMVTATITDISSGNACDVPLNILDKQVPKLSCGDLFYSCEAAYPNIELPEVFEVLVDESIISDCQEFDIAISNIENSIADLNLYLDFNFLGLANGSINLISPNGTEVELFQFSDISSCSGSELKINFVDQSIQGIPALDFQCLSGGSDLSRFNSTGDLSDFNGENANGTWKLEVCAVGAGIVNLNNIQIAISDDNNIFPLPIVGFTGINQINETTFSLNDFDGCGPAVLSFFDIDENFDCTASLNKEVLRTWNVVDQYGNTNSCIETISFERRAPDEISLPDTFSVANGNALSCELQMPIANGVIPNIGWNALANGNPSPDNVYYDAPNDDIVKWYGTGRPVIGGCYDLNFTYTDIKINSCSEEDSPNCFKVTRTWIAIHPCTNVPFEYVQQIFVADDKAPEITPIDDVTISTQGFSCETNWVVPIPSITDNCSTESSITYNVFSAEGVVTYNSFLNQYTVRNLPVGVHSIRVIAEDCCGNESSEFISVEVRDQILPSVVCETYVTANLSQDGFAKVFAQTFDEGSHDGCGPVYFKVIRMDNLQGTLEGTVADQISSNCVSENGDDDLVTSGNQIYFDDYVHLCCDDLAGDVQVVLRVFDVNPGTGPIHPDRMKAGGDLYNRFNDCMPRVTVEDKQAPTIVCPVNVTLECNQWYQDTSLTGSPTAYDNCSLTGITFEDDVNLNQCQVGTITRTWTATDHTGRTATCEQIITMQDSTDPVIEYPTDRTIDCADLQDLSIAGQPIVDDNCALIGWNYSDQIFPIEGGCKLKVIRTWSGMDLCDWTAYTGTQTIIAEDNQPPVLLNVPEDITVECDNIPSPFDVEFQDDCGNSSTLNFEENRIDEFCPNGYTLQRIWTAVDVCGNEVSDVQLITVQDNTVPVFDSIPQDMNLSCSAQAPSLLLSAQDNCDPNPTVSVVEDIVPGDCPNRFTLVRTWTVVDACGNSDMISQNLSFSDDEAPQLLNVPDDITINCGEDIPIVTIVTATDNCDTNLEPILTEIEGPDYCSDGIILTRIWEATDACGNSTSDTQKIFLFDNDPPVFDNLPEDITISCSDDLPDSKLNATDACTEEVVVSFNMGIQFLNCAQNQILTRTWTAEDDCGNIATHSMTITITDDEAPFIDETLNDITISCDAQIPSSSVTVRDNCDGNPSVMFIEEEVPGGCPNEKILKRSWTLSDACDNTETLNQSITIVDEEKPVFSSTPVDISVECDDIPAANSLTAMDNCDGLITPIFSEVRTNGSCIDSYMIVRTWFASDGCGNMETIIQNITVTDTQSPTITVGPNLLFASCENVPTPGTAVATDNCDMSLTISFSERQIDSTCLDLYRLERTWSTFDNCGNQATFVQNVIVSDDVPPSLVGVPEDLTVDCNAIPAPATVDAVDNCDPEITVNFEENFDAGLCEVQGILTRIWTAVDRCGNVTTDSQVINVGNSQLPEFDGVPANINVSCDDIPAVVTPTALGACGTMTTITFNELIVEDDCRHNYQIQRTWNAIDDCGNENSATQLINVSDDEDPTLSNLPNDVTISCTDQIPFMEPTVTDNCDAGIELEFMENEESGICEGELIIIRTWIAEDDCGNVAMHSQKISILDNIPPVFEMIPDDITVSCEDQDMNFGSPEILDLCDEDASFTLLEVREITCPGTFILTRTWTAMDDCGNTSTATQEVTIFDDELPELSGSPADITVSCEAIPTAEILTAEDNCDDNPTVDFVEVRIDGDCAGNYILERTWIATDHCGNSVAEVQTITVMDLIEPEFVNFPSDFEVSCIDDPLIDNVQIIANDNCDNNVNININETVEDSICLNQLIIVRVYTITDHCGNSIERTLRIAVNDDLPPAFPLVQEDISVSCENVPDPTLIVATDNCVGPVDLVFTESVVDSACIGNLTLLRRWIATDACGNVDSVNQRIQVFDNTPPVLSEVEPIIEISCSDPIPPAPNVTATDNCGLQGGVNFFDDVVEEICPGYTYKIRRTWIVGDQCSNSADVSQVVSISDSEAPIFTSIINDVSVSCDEIPGVETITFEDNCDPNPTITFSDERLDGQCSNEYTIKRTITIADVCGNANDHLQTLTVFDNTVPLIDCPEDITVAIDNTVDPAGDPLVCEIFVNVPLPVVSDNCNSQPVITNSFISSPDGNASGFYPIGTTTVSFTVNDLCGNSSICFVDITVLDQVAPSIACSGVTLVTIDPATENMGVLVVDSFLSIAKDCQDFEILFSPQMSSFINFDCDDVGDTIRVDAIARDISGNVTGCFNDVRVTDPLGVCTMAVAGIAGMITTEDLLPVGNTLINVNNQPILQTNDDGDYLLDEVAQGLDYTLIPELNHIDRAKITTLDLIRLGRHLIGLEPLDSPYKLIAADVDYSNAIDVFDLIELQKLIVHNIEEFSQGNAWRFIDEEHSFSDETNPFIDSFNEFIKIENYSEFVSDQDFVAVQLGNLNEGEDIYVNTAEKAIWNWQVPSIKLKEDREIVLPIYAESIPTCDGLQLEWSFDDMKIEVIDILPGQFEPVFNIQKNKLLLSAIMNSQKAVNAHQPLFTLSLKVLSDCSSDEIFSSTQKHLSTYAVVNNHVSHTIELNVEHLDGTYVQLNKDLPVLFSNRPNPFTDQTTLRFNLLSDEDLTIQIVDVAGKALYRQSMFLKAGYQEVVIRRDQLNAEGVLFCQLITTKGTVTQKLLLVSQ